MAFWENLNEALGRATEKRALTIDQREDWTAAIICVREAWYPEGLFKRVAPKGGGDGLAVGRADQAKVSGRPPRWVKGASGIGPVMLAYEARQNGAITQRQLDRWTWDTVLWVKGWNPRTGRPIIAKLADDFGKFKAELREQLDKFGLQRPRSDELFKFLGYATIIAAVGTGIAIAVFTAGIGTPAAVAIIAGSGLIGAGGGLAYAEAADNAEQRVVNQAAEVGIEVEMDGSEALRDAASAVGAAAAAYGAGGKTQDIVQAGVAGYYADETAKAKAAEEAKKAEQSGLATWAKSTTGMVTIGVAALLLVVLVVRK